MKQVPDYTRCEHRFYFKDKDEWSSWSESFEPGPVTSEIDSELAEVEVRNVEPLLTVENILPFISAVTENAINYTNNEIRKEVQTTANRLEGIVEHIRDGEADTAVDLLLDEIQLLNERQEVWKVAMEDIGDEAAETLKSMREGENR